MKIKILITFASLILLGTMACNEPSKDVCNCLEKAVVEGKLNSIRLISCQRKNEKYLESLNEKEYIQYIRDLSICQNVDKLNTLDKRYQLFWGKWKNSENLIWEFKPNGTTIGQNASGAWRLANSILTIDGFDYQVLELSSDKYKIKSINQRESKIWEATKIVE